jgi:EAL domain-containing protein (putative c-di-GMP-specific phosphodiesterase class I)/GGDEF domain-containing protein
MSRSFRQEEYFLLRSEWLRFRNHLFDSTTELPALAAVLDDVRRLLEERGTLGLVYLDLADAARLETLHGWQWYDETLRAFARALLDLKAHDYLAARDVVAMLSVRSDKFLLILGGSRPSSLEPGNLDPLVARLRERILVTLQDRLPPGAPSPLVFHHGHALLHRDPMLRAERALYRALDEAMHMSLRQRSRDEDLSAQLLDALIQREQIVTQYQPIVRLADMVVLGHEVFSRGAAGGAFEDPDRLFALAERTGRLIGLERLCRRRAVLTARGHLRQGGKLFVNTSAPALRDPELMGDAFHRQLAAHGMSPADIVFEVTERVAVEDRLPYRETLRALKAHGFGVAIDDMGAGYASLQSLVELEPDYLKFDIALVRNIHRSLIKRSLLETLVELSQKIGARVIAEGIEAPSELATLREMGVPLGQGRYLAPPRAVPLEVQALL